MVRARFIAMLTILVYSAPLVAGDALIWPQFRGPTGMGVSGAKNVPVKWGQEQNLAWKIKMPGPGTSSPILVGDRLYLTYYTGFKVNSSGPMDDLRLHLLCLDRHTGKPIWTKEVQPRLPEQARIRDDHGYASHTPIADSERLYVFFGKTGVFAFDFDGKQLWQAEVGDGLNGWGSAAPPNLIDDVLVVNASVESESLIALDKRTGKERWRAGRIVESWNMPIAVKAGGRTEVVVAVMGDILGFDVKTGARLWSCKTDIAWYMVPSLVAEGDMIYCIGGRSGGALAVKAGGQGDVTRTHRTWVGKKGSNVSSPIYHAGHLYWMNDNLGVAYCADAKTGEVLYEQRLDGAQQVYSSPVLAEGRLYYVGREGRTFVVAARPEFELLASNDLRDRTPFNASPAVADGKLYVRSDMHLFCIGK